MSVCANFQLSNRSRSEWKVCCGVVGWVEHVTIMSNPNPSYLELLWVELRKGCVLTFVYPRWRMKMLWKRRSQALSYCPTTTWQALDLWFLLTTHLWFLLTTLIWFLLTKLVCVARNQFSVASVGSGSTTEMGISVSTATTTTPIKKTKTITI